MPPGRRRYENQCKDPPFATSFFLAQAPLALKGAKDGAPTEPKQDQIPRASAALGMTALKTKGTERFFVRPGPTQNDNGSDRDGSTGKSACATLEGGATLKAKSRDQDPRRTGESACTTDAAWKAALQKPQGPASFL